MIAPYTEINTSTNTTASQCGVIVYVCVCCLAVICDFDSQTQLRTQIYTIHKFQLDGVKHTNTCFKYCYSTFAAERIKKIATTFSLQIREKNYLSSSNEFCKPTDIETLEKNEQFRAAHLRYYLETIFKSKCLLNCRPSNCIYCVICVWWNSFHCELHCFSSFFQFFFYLVFLCQSKYIYCSAGALSLCDVLLTIPLKKCLDSLKVIFCDCTSVTLELAKNILWWFGDVQLT